MPLILRRQPHETWREAVARVGAENRLEQECLAHFDKLVSEGEAKDVAALYAVLEWDCAEFEQ